MKKNLFVLVVFFLIIVAILSIAYYNYNKINTLAKMKNKEYEAYIKEEILGSSLITLVNKVTDENEKNGIEKDSKNRYIENEENSIKIEIKFSESDSIYEMEAISALGIENFVKNYNSMKFKCTKTEYHKKTNTIKYMLFEQI